MFDVTHKWAAALEMRFSSLFLLLLWIRWESGTDGLGWYQSPVGRSVCVRAACLAGRLSCTGHFPWPFVSVHFLSLCFPFHLLLLLIFDSSFWTLSLLRSVSLSLLCFSVFATNLPVFSFLQLFFSWLMFLLWQWECVALSQKWLLIALFFGPQRFCWMLGSLFCFSLINVDTVC